MATLVEDGTEHLYQLQERTSIGRDRQCDICVDDPMVSTSHAEIVRDVTGAYRLRDLGSRRGTFVGDRQVHEIELREGDELLIGPARMRFHARGTTGPIPATPAGPQGSGNIDELTRLRAIAELSRAIGVEHDLRKVIGRVLDTCFQLLAADRGAIAVFQPGSKTPYLTLSRERNGEDSHFALSTTVASVVMDTHEPHLSAEIDSDAALHRSASLSVNSVRSLMAAPLLYRADDVELLGIVQLDSRADTTVFLPRDLELLSVIAGQAALAIKNAMLARQVWSAVDDDWRHLERVVRDLPAGVIVLDRRGRCRIANNWVLSRAELMDRSGLRPAILDGLAAGGLIEPTERGGRLYGRGAADDKAGVMTHLAVLRAYGGRPPIGVTLFVEGEEESGSPTLTALMQEHRDALTCDVIVIADSANPAVDVPGLTTSLRGLVDVTVEVAMLERQAHSGVFGGPVGDALTALCRTLASLHDEHGDVAVPGLVRGTTDAPDPDEATFRADAGLLPGVELIGTGSIAERSWLKPAVAVLGIDAPRTDQIANVLLPRARAVVSMRLAPGDDAAKAQRALTEHLEAHVPWGAQVRVTPGRGVAEPISLDTTGAAFDAARRAFAQAYGTAVVESGLGGSIGFIAEFARTFPGAAVLITGVGDPASRWHGIDESLHLEMFGRGVHAEALLLAELAGPAPAR